MFHSVDTVLLFATSLPVPAYSPVSLLVVPFPPVPTLDVPILASLPRSYAVAKAYATVIKEDSISLRILPPAATKKKVSPKDSSSTYPPIVVRRGGGANVV
jgi:hypothetical protein